MPVSYSSLRQETIFIVSTAAATKNASVFLKEASLALLARIYGCKARECGSTWYPEATRISSSSTVCPAPGVCFCVHNSMRVVHLSRD